MKRSLIIGLILAMTLTVLPAASLANPAEAGGCSVVHYVRAGETLASIAAHYGVDVHALARANNISNPDWIYVGMRLCIPGTPPVPPQPPQPQPPKPQPPAPGQCIYHRVQPGQTLSGIARSYGVDMWTLARQNGISNPNRIYVGQVLLISCPWPPAPPQPPPPPPPHPKPPYYPPPPQPGDPTPGCSIAPVLGFGRVWYNNPNVRNKLGCPTAPETGFGAVEQGFYSGYVVEDQYSRTLYVMFNHDGWVQYPATWQPGEPINNPYLVPPPGFYQPEYSIGKMWRNEDNYSQRLGWARYMQRPVTASRQTFEHGLMLWTASSGFYVLYNDGTWQHYN